MHFNILYGRFQTTVYYGIMYRQNNNYKCDVYTRTKEQYEM